MTFLKIGTDLQRLKAISRATYNFVLKKVFTFADFFIPENSHSIVMNSTPDFDAQILEIIPHLDLNRFSVILLHDSSPIPESILRKYPKVGILKKLSLKGFLATRSARVVIFTHGNIFSNYNRNFQTIINAWHGFPIKSVGESIGVEIDRADFLLTLSENTGSEFLKLYSSDRRPQLLPVGYPRNDLLNIAHSSEIKVNKLAWLPTYRTSHIGELRNDGQDSETGMALSFENLRRLDQFLESKNIQVVIKPHPVATVRIPSNLAAVRFATPEELKEQTYSFLNQFDGLISDYSSVIVDFLPTKKPIYIFAPDANEYSKNRGISEVALERLELKVGSTVEALMDMLNGSPKEFIANDSKISWWHDNNFGSAGRNLAAFINELIENPLSRK